MKHRLSEIQDAFYFASGDPGSDSCAILSRETGRLYYVSEYGDSDEELPEDLDDNDRYIAIPDKHDLDLGASLAHRFIRDHAPTLCEEVERIFSRRGAYARLKGLLDTHGLLDAWHAYEAAKTEAALRAWCAENDITLTPDPPSNPNA